MQGKVIYIRFQCTANRKYKRLYAKILDDQQMSGPGSHRALPKYQFIYGDASIDVHSTPYSSAPKGPKSCFSRPPGRSMNWIFSENTFKGAHRVKLIHWARRGWIPVPRTAPFSPRKGMYRGLFFPTLKISLQKKRLKSTPPVRIFRHCILLHFLMQVSPISLGLIRTSAVTQNLRQRTKTFFPGGKH